MAKVVYLKRTYSFSVTWAGSALWSTAQDMRNDADLGVHGRIHRIVTRLTTDDDATVTEATVCLANGPYPTAPDFDDVPDEDKAVEIVDIVMAASDTTASDDSNFMAAPVVFSAHRQVDSNGIGLWLNVKATAASGNGDSTIKVTIYYERVVL